MVRHRPANEVRVLGAPARVAPSVGVEGGGLADGVREYCEYVS